MLLDLTKTFTFYLAGAIEAFAAIIILLAAIQTFWRSMMIYLKRPPLHTEERKVDIRMRLGRWLSLALEFELAADILRTAIAPSWNEIGKLAAIIVLRTALNYFLEREEQNASQLEPLSR